MEEKDVLGTGVRGTQMTTGFRRLSRIIISWVGASSAAMHRFVQEMGYNYCIPNIKQFLNQCQNNLTWAKQKKNWNRFCSWLLELSLGLSKIESHKHLYKNGRWAFILEYTETHTNTRTYTSGVYIYPDALTQSHTFVLQLSLNTECWFDILAEQSLLPFVSLISNWRLWVMTKKGVVGER